MRKYTIGLDFGSLSGRALLVDVSTGEEVCECVSEYAHAVMSETLPDGTRLPVDSAVQHPQDYLDVLSTVLRGVLKRANVQPSQVIGVGVDFTSATLLPVDKDLTPLCFDPKFASHPKAYVTMWKDHTAAPQAELFERVCHETGAPYLDYSGGKCAVEHGIPKILSILQNDESVYQAAYRILEAGDWVTMLLTGTEKKGFNFAACKECWYPHLGGYPPKEFMKALDPRFENVVEDKFGGDTVSYDPCFGTITAKAAEMTGLLEGTPVATPYIDGYSPLPACGITGSRKLSMIVGTSLCHQMCDEKTMLIPGLNAVIPGSFYKDLTCYEAGQSSCGDQLAWFIENCIPASYSKEAEERNIGIHQLLREKLEGTVPGSSGLIALDWFNGNRNILNDASLSGMILGLTLQTKPEDIYRALLEGSVFGTRRILEVMDEGGLQIDEIIASGGIARKDPFMMQMFADVTNRTIRVCGSKQAPALSVAMFAAVAAGKSAGGYDSIEDAATVMSNLLDLKYEPNPENHAIYNKVYEQYRIVHDTFGLQNLVMKRLREIRAEVL